MAVQNYITNYTPSEDTASIPEESAIRGHGVREAYLQNSVNVTNGDSIGSTYVIHKNVPGDAILAALDIETDALTALTACQIGVYDANPALSAPTPFAVNALASGLDLHTAAGKQVGIDGLNQLTHEQTMQPIWQLAGHTLLTKRGFYDIVLTLTQAATATGVMTARTTLIPAG